MCLTFLLKAGKHSIGFKLIFHFPPPASKTSDLINVKEAQLTLKQRFSILAAHLGITRGAFYWRLGPALQVLNSAGAGYGLGMLGVHCKVTSSSWFGWDLPGFCTESSASWESPQSLANLERWCPFPNVKPGVEPASRDFQWGHAFCSPTHKWSDSPGGQSQPSLQSSVWGP